MNIPEKLNAIRNWFAQNFEEEDVNELRVLQEPEKLIVIEELLGEPLPEAFRTLYETYNGEDGEGAGAFCGHEFMSLDDVVFNLEYARSLLKPEDRFVADPEKSEELIEALVGRIMGFLPESQLKDWVKIEFSITQNSRSGPTVFRKNSAGELIEESVDFDFSKWGDFQSVVRELHTLEKDSWNWDKMEITVHRYGEKEVVRKDYNFEDELPLTSFPEDAIRKKYYHYKWLPFLSDYGGNFIGMDLDPDEKGRKGQIIVFGRDEEDMYVVANSLDEFLDFVLNLTQEKPDVLLRESHLHDEFRELIVR